MFRIAKRGALGVRSPAIRMTLARSTVYPVHNDAENWLQSVFLP
jgi:hypothetical protein